MTCHWGLGVMWASSVSRDRIICSLVKQPFYSLVVNAWIDSPNWVSIVDSISIKVKVGIENDRIVEV